MTKAWCGAARRPKSGSDLALTNECASHVRARVDGFLRIRQRGNVYHRQLAPSMRGGNCGCQRFLAQCGPAPAVRRGIVQNQLDVIRALRDACIPNACACDGLLSVGTLFYSALFFTEGIGLLLRKRWAEYFTIISTGAFIPLEIYELLKHVTPVKILLMILNVAIVVYLVLRLRKERR